MFNMTNFPGLLDRDKTNKNNLKAVQDSALRVRQININN